MVGTVGLVNVPPVVPLRMDTWAKDVTAAGNSSRLVRTRKSQIFLTFNEVKLQFNYFGLFDLAVREIPESFPDVHFFHSLKYF